MKKLLTLALVTLTLSSTFVACKKDKTPTTVTSCFGDNYNGSYNGNIVISGVPSTATIKLTKTACTSATLESSSFNTISVNSLSASAGGGYNGKTSNNESISISLDNNSIAISGVINFTGSK